MFVVVRWAATFFSWSPETDPRKDLAAWRALAKSDDAIVVTTDCLAFPYNSDGPRALGLSDELTLRGPGPDYFGVIARCELPLTRGKWHLSTLSDDGVRVLVDGKPVIENWTWHGPTRNEGTIELEADGRVECVVEHFEIDGYAVLKLDIEKAEN